MRKVARSLAISLPLVAMLAGCEGIPYKLDVPQGNLVSAEQLEKLEFGMTRNQVRFVLGTPLVADPFHPDRWDYFFSLRHDDKVAAVKRFTIVFTNDALSGVSGDQVPARFATAVPTATGSPTGSLSVAQ